MSIIFSTLAAMAGPDSRRSVAVPLDVLGIALLLIAVALMRESLQGYDEAGETAIEAVLAVYTCDGCRVLARAAQRIHPEPE